MINSISFVRHLATQTPGINTTQLPQSEQTSELNVYLECLCLLRTIEHIVRFLYLIELEICRMHMICQLKCPKNQAG
jgi:hypothetical protein